MKEPTIKFYACEKDKLVHGECISSYSVSGNSIYDFSDAFDMHDVDCPYDWIFPVTLDYEEFVASLEYYLLEKCNLFDLNAEFVYYLLSLYRDLKDEYSWVDEILVVITDEKNRF